MSVGFRKSLFGFNPSDVIEYIESSQRRFVTKENELEKTVEELKENLTLSEEKLSLINAEKDALSEKLAAFGEKYEEIERLSESIGRLYLVAQANANALMENSEKSSQLARAEVNKNISAIDDAHLSLDELKKSIVKTSDDFTSEIDRLIASLNTTKEQLAENALEDSEIKNSFAELLAEVQN